MFALWQFVKEYQLEVHLEVKLSCFQAGRLADLVQLIAHSSALITDPRRVRSKYHIDYRLSV